MSRLIVARVAYNHAQHPIHVAAIGGREIRTTVVRIGDPVSGSRLENRKEQEGERRGGRERERGGRE
jgi:hypothetical protein